MPDVVESQIFRDIEKRTEAKKEAKRAVGNDAGETGGQNYFRLELRRAIQHFGGERVRRRAVAEDGGDARAHAGRQENAPLRGPQLQQPADQRSKAGANLAIGPSRPPEPPVPMVRALAMILTIGTRAADLSLPK